MPPLENVVREVASHRDPAEAGRPSIGDMPAIACPRRPRVQARQKVL